VIVCAGLFDYLPDRVASRMIEQLMRELKPGAMLLIGNVSSEHPNRTSMEYFMEWVLQLRSSEDLVRLVPERLRTEGEFTVQVVGEPLGINLFLRVTRRGPVETVAA
jgi:extracellular factor (EF) 3-hydroxypalmitic acid methyl ester biosynthesis protein